MSDDENTPWQYKPEKGSVASVPDLSNGSNHKHARSTSPKSVSWESTEFIEQHHSASWYGALILITAGLASLVYVIAKDLIATITIVVVGIIVWIFSSQKPKPANYEITESGLSINGKLYNYANYKSFTIIQEGEFSSINLFPLKRFMPPLSAYFDPKDEQKITQALGNYLPYEQRKLDNIDRLSRRLRL
jgi:hypothetical protein